MALYLGRADHDAAQDGFKRIVVEFEGGELVLAPGHGDALELEVTIGHEHEKHELALHEEGLAQIRSQSKLIKIEDIPPSRPGNYAVRQQSQLISIEDTRGRAFLPPVTILL